MVKPKSAILTGGLGNQLFQIAAVLGSASGKVQLRADIGYPRQTNGMPDCLLLSLPDNVEITQVPRFFELPARAAGLLLRGGLYKNPKGIKTYFDGLAGYFARLLLQILSLRRLKIFVSQDVGFGGPLSCDVDLLIGYFQSWKYSENSALQNILMTMMPKNDSKQYSKLLNRIRQEKPLILHIRLGDYEEQNQFGVLPEQYYLNAIREIKVNEGKPIWIFTNDAKRCGKLYMELLKLNAEVVEDQELDSGQVLNLMRYGSAFIIANSSYSWWAAKLRFDESAPVVAPSPWFRKMPEPRDLIPEGWKRVDSGWN